jgi:hypothetical protein
VYVRDKWRLQGLEVEIFGWSEREGRTRLSESEGMEKVRKGKGEGGEKRKMWDVCMCV